MLNCWWFDINFRWRSSPILFRFCPFSLPWCPLVNRIVGVFNNICCRSLKSAKRFSIASSYYKKKQNKRTRNKNRYEKKREVTKPIICLIHLLNCWWFAINFRWRSSPILFWFCRFSLPWCPLVNRIVAFLMIYAVGRWKQVNASQLPITTKKKKIKRTRNKNRYEKKKREAKPDRTEKKQIFITVRNTKISGVFKRTNFYSNR